MKHTTQQSNTARNTFLTLFVVSLMFFGLVGTTFAQGWVAPISGPTAEPNTPPTQEFYHPLTTVGGSQTKVGKFGVGSTSADPGALYDFRVDGPTSLLANAWAGATWFVKNVLVGTSTNPTTVQVNGHFRSLGTGADIQSGQLTHSSPTPLPVCSDAVGNLRLCPQPTTPSGSSGPGGGASTFCATNPTHPVCTGGVVIDPGSGGGAVVDPGTGTSGGTRGGSTGGGVVPSGGVNGG